MKDSSMTPGEVRANWQRIRDQGAGRYVELELEPGLSIGFIESESGTGGLAIPVDPREKVPEGVDGDGLELKRITLKLGKKMQHCVALTCSTRELEKVFSEFIASVISRMRDGLPGIPALTGAVREYRSLLKRSRSGDVTRETAAGLVGELIVLKRLIERDTGAWRCWNGPLGQTHDFLSGTLAIEVKTTQHQAEPAFEVANAMQLFPPEGGELYLVNHVVIPNAQGQLTVSELSNEIRGLLNDASGFDERVTALGFDPQAPGAWDIHRFQLTETAMYAVTEGFPRMPRDTLERAPNGVSHIRYRVHLSIASGFRVRDSLVESAVYDRMANGYEV